MPGGNAGAAAKRGPGDAAPSTRPRPGDDKQILICPSVDGVRNWMAPACNGKSHILDMPIFELCMDFVRSVADDGTDGKLDMGWIFGPPPDSDGKRGGVRAVDLVTRKTIWEQRSRALPAASLLATAGRWTSVTAGNVSRW